MVGQQYTDSQGNYLFPGLMLGKTYFVEIDVESLPDFVNRSSSYEQTGLGETAGDNVSYAVPSASRPHLTDQNFSYPPADGARRFGFIGNRVWFDADNSGGNEAQGGESGLEGVTVILRNHTDLEIARTTTGDDGYYMFLGLPLDDNGGDGDADYTVEVDTSTLPNFASRQSSFDGEDGGGDSSSRVTLSSESPSNFAQNFSYPRAMQSGAIGNRVWLDADSGNDGDEMGGLENVVVELLDSNGYVVSVETSNKNGDYLFAGLSLGTYQVRIADENFAAGGILEGMQHTGSAVSSAEGDLLGSVTLTNATPTRLDQDFGYRGSGMAGTIGGLVWLDRDADGSHDSAEGETPIGGVTVDLYRDLDGNGEVNAGEPKIGTTVSGDDGDYLFGGLPVADVGNTSGGSHYIIDISDESGFLSGSWQSIGVDETDDNSQIDPYAVNLTAAAPEYLSSDVGYYRDLAALGNFVWYDADGDGRQDSGEFGLTGVSLTLTITYPNGTKVVTKTQTDGEGHYSFGNLLADEDHNGVETGLSYSIGVATPEGMSRTQVDRTSGGISDLNDSDAHSGVAAFPVQGSQNVGALNPATDEPFIASYDFGFTTTNNSSNFSNWQENYDNSLEHSTNPGVKDGPMHNPDGDLYSNLIEYALLTDPGSGVQARDPFCIELDSISGELIAVFTRSLGSHSDLSYTLEARDTLVGDGNDATGWFEVTTFAGISDNRVSITDNGDGTETVQFVDLEDIDLPNAAGKLALGEGYIRLRIDGIGLSCREHGLHPNLRMVRADSPGAA